MDEEKGQERWKMERWMSKKKQKRDADQVTDTD